jgi:hypothetical protein
VLAKFIDRNTFIHTAASQTPAKFLIKEKRENRNLPPALSLSLSSKVSDMLPQVVLVGDVGRGRGRVGWGRGGGGGEANQNYKLQNNIQ